MTSLVPSKTGRPVAIIRGPKDLGPPLYHRSGSRAEIFGQGLGVLPGLSLSVTATIWMVLAVAVAGGSGPAWLLGPVAAFAGLLTLPFLTTSHFYRTRRMKRIRDVTASLNAAGAGPVRLTGTVEAAAPATLDPNPTPDAGEGAGTQGGVVLVRSLFFEATRSGRASPVWREDVRGLPFVLRLPGGEAIRIEPASLFLIEPPRVVKSVALEVRRALGASLWGLLRRQVLQSDLRIGDAVELVGQVEIQVDQKGVGAPGRGTPLVASVHAAWPEGIWIRRTGTQR